VYSRRIKIKVSSDIAASGAMLYDKAKMAENANFPSASAVLSLGKNAV
jgi:hypothetical protein